MERLISNLGGWHIVCRMEKKLIIEKTTPNLKFLRNQRELS